MGWWHRIVGRLLGSTEDGLGVGTPPEAPSEEDGGAVATLEAPAPPAALPDVPEPDQEDVWWAPEGATEIELIEPSRPHLSADELALESLLFSHFDGHDLDIPALPHVPQKVMQSLRNPACDADQLGREIAEDQVVAAAVLRTCNSPMYRGLERISALEPAVARLGQQAIRTLMMHQSLRAAIFHGQGSDRGLTAILWSRSLAGAAVMRELAGLTGLDIEDAFVLGLLHDIGNVMVLRLVQAHEKATRNVVDIELFEYLCHECHQEFGELIAEAWKLPPKLSALIAGHHLYPAADDALRIERLHLHLTDMILALGCYAPWGDYSLFDSRPVRDLGLAERDDFLDLLYRLPGTVEEYIAHL